VVLRGFLIGYQKRVTYGPVLRFHLVPTLSTAQFFLAPFSRLLCFAGWPMLAACVVLYSLRDLDTIAVS
jgi:putative oxidoreductase